ncbi:MAG: nitroreductase family protein [Halanaerobiales bacterium]
MDAEKLLRERRTIREYTDQEIDSKTLENIVDIARFAPTGNNVQPWEMVVVTDEKKLKKITDYKDQNRSAKAAIGVFMEDKKHNVKDASALTTYLNLAATAEGLGACWLNVYQKEYEDEIKEMLNVPEEYTLFSFVTLGYPAEDPEVEKRDLGDVIHREEF